jgi:hypothetical protein
MEALATVKCGWMRLRFAPPCASVRPRQSRADCSISRKSISVKRRSSACNVAGGWGVQRAGHALQLTAWIVPESPSHLRRSGSDQRVPLLLASSMLALWKAPWAAVPCTVAVRPA